VWQAFSTDSLIHSQLFYFSLQKVRTVRGTSQQAVIPKRVVRGFSNIVDSESGLRHVGLGTYLRLDLYFFEYNSVSQVAFCVLPIITNTYTMADFEKLQREREEFLATMY